MKKIWLLCLLVAGAAQAAEEFRLTLLVQFFYQDAAFICKTAPVGEEFYLRGVIEGDTLSQLELSNHPKIWPYLPIYRTLDLAPKEKKKAATFLDNKNQRWLSSLNLNAKEIAWLVVETGIKGFGCAAPKEIIQLQPSLVGFEFEREGIDDGIFISYSPTVPLTGTLKGGNPFSLKFRLTQKLYEVWE